MPPRTAHPRGQSRGIKTGGNEDGRKASLPCHRMLRTTTSCFPGMAGPGRATLLECAASSARDMQVLLTVGIEPGQALPLPRSTGCSGLS
jgi:hypothetical protein